MAKSNGETFLWSLFAAGGAVAALAMPALVFITGLAIPFINAGQITSVPIVTSGHVMRLIASVVGRVFLFAVISLSLFHCVHRIRHTLKDLGVHGAGLLVAVLCYGSATAGTALAAWLMFTLSLE